MKKFIKRRWPLLFGVLGIALLLVFLYYKGFRITYAPELENSWDAISACAAWAGVVASFIAIWYAIQIPKKIAEEQNRITLFEERYAAYACILSLEVFATAIDKKMFEDGGKDINGKIQTLEDKIGLYCLHFATTLGFPPHLKQGSVDIESTTQTIAILKNHEAKAMTLPFLFYTNDDRANKMKRALTNIFEPLLCFMTEVVTFKFDERDTVNDENRQKFIAAIKEFKREYADEIEQELLIKTR